MGIKERFEGILEDVKDNIFTIYTQREILESSIENCIEQDELWMYDTKLIELYEKQYPLQFESVILQKYYKKFFHSGKEYTEGQIQAALKDILRDLYYEVDECSMDVEASLGTLKWLERNSEYGKEINRILTEAQREAYLLSQQAVLKKCYFKLFEDIFQ